MKEKELRVDMANIATSLRLNIYQVETIKVAQRIIKKMVKYSSDKKSWVSVLEDLTIALKKAEENYRKTEEFISELQEELDIRKAIEKVNEMAKAHLFEEDIKK